MLLPSLVSLLHVLVPKGDRAIAAVIARNRPAVLLIWVLVLAASLLAFARPA